MRSEGSSRLRRISRRKLVFGRLVEILTMMQSCASAAKLRAAGQIFRSASEPVRITASRHLGSSIRQRAEKPARAPNSSVVMLVPVTPFRPLLGRRPCGVDSPRGELQVITQVTRVPPAVHLVDLALRLGRDRIGGINAGGPWRSGFAWTHHWREMDSNYWSRQGRIHVL